MILSEEQRRVKALLTETIVLLCKNGLDFKSEFSIEALIGVTLDRNEVLLININESVRNDVDQDEVSVSDNSIDDISDSKIGVANTLREMNDLHNTQSKQKSQCPTDPNVSNNMNECNNPNRSNRPPRNNQYQDPCFKRSNNENYENEENQIQQKMRRLNSQQSNRQQNPRLSPINNNNNNDNLNTSGASNVQSTSEHPVAVSTPKFKSEPPEIEGSSMQSICNESTAYPHWPTASNEDCLPDFQNLVHGTTALSNIHLPSKSSPFSSIQLQPISIPTQQQQQHMQQQQQNASTTAVTTVTSLSSLSMSTLQTQQQQQQQQQSSFFESLVLSNGQNSSRGRYKCNICFKEMRLLRDLRAHLATKHNLEKDFSCSVCGTGFTYKHNLFVHLRTVHGMNKPVNELI